MIAMRFFTMLAVALTISLPSYLFAGSLADEFVIDSNPGGGWTHGFNDTAVGGGNDILNDIPFQLLHLESETAFNPGDRWTGDGTLLADFPPNDLLSVSLGAGKSAQDDNHWGGGAITWDSGVSYHTWGDTSAGGSNGLSGDDTIFSTFTVSVDGDYDIIGTWTENGNSGGATVDVFLNGISLSGPSSVDLDIADDTTTIQSLGVSLTAGDEVSFRTLRDTDVTTGGSVRADLMVTPLIPIDMEVFVDRQTGIVTLENNTANSVDIIGYSILSDAGALNAAEWDSFADTDGAWLEFSAEDTDLSEGTLSSKSIATPSVQDLGNVWRRNPNSEDIEVVVALANDTVVSLPVEFTGLELNTGDLDFDGDVDTADWALFRAGQGIDMSGMNPIDAYALGDLDGDLDNDTADFRIFKDIFIAQSNSSSFSNATSVPEPSSVVFVLIACGMLRKKQRKHLA